jgi:sugar O-acyltransferase (sialic acid O-acetyltransferase NeuD family)
VLGGGGHARVVIDAARSSGAFEVVGVLDDRAGSGDASLDGVPVVGPISPEVIAAHGVQQAIIAIGDNAVRARIAARLDGLVTWATVVHARAYVAPSASIEAGSLVCAMAVVQPGTRVGRHAIVNTSASVDHDGAIGDFAHIGPGANLSGTVSVGEGALLGIGSRVIPGRCVGAWSIVGAGATVVRDLPANVTAVGVPAKVIEEREPGWHLA